MKVYIVDQKMRDLYFKIFKKKISYEGIPDSYKRNKRFLTKKRRKEIKRIKKHAFKKHIKYTNK